MKQWRKIKSKLVFDRKWFKVRQDTVELPDGKIREWFYWDSVDSVMVVGIRKDKKLVMERQYRYLVGNEVIEFPAGYIQDGESPEEAAVREFHEETGLKARKIEKLGSFYETYGQLNRKIHIFCASDLDQGNKRLDKGHAGYEDIRSIEYYKLREVIEMVMNNTINSSPSALAVMLLQEKIKQDKKV